ncbi:MAG: hypothetical protein QG599_1984, partial [Pseudomonadota bacterium]|nr:hypothetical protein [Pseudomonadota bacterium]
MGDFNRCINFILAEEGGYIAFPADQRTSRTTPALTRHPS